MKSIKIFHHLLSVTLVAGLLAPAQADPDLPIFDTHVHYNEDASVAYTPERIVELMDGADVPRALVSSTSDDNTLALLEAGGSDLIVPILRPYHGKVHSGNWFADPTTLGYLRERWSSGRYAGIGEFHLHTNESADSDTVRAVAAIAVAADKYMHVHADADAINKIFAHTPEVKILWAHAGLGDPPSVIARTLAAHDALWADISIRDYEIAPGGKLDPEWRDLFMAFPDRLMAASDTWVTTRWDQYQDILEAQRAWIRQLPPAVAKAVAHGNAVRLFGAGDTGLTAR